MKTIIPPQFRPFVFILLIANVSVRAQVRRTREKYLSVGANAALLGYSYSHTSNDWGPGFTRTGAFLVSDDGRFNSMMAANSSIGVNTGFMWKNKNNKNMTGIQADFSRNRSSYVFNNPYSYTEKVTTGGDDHDADDTGKVVTKTYDHWGESDSYFKYAVAVQELWYRNNHSILNGDTYFYLKESFGQTFMHVNRNNEIHTNDEEIRNFENGTSLKAETVSYNPTTNIIGSEIGFRAFSPDKDRALDVGIVLYTPLSPTYTREYTYYKDKDILGQRDISFGSSSILLNASYTFSKKLKEHAMDSTKLEREKIDLLAKSRSENGRNFEVQQKITLNSDLVTAKVWDRGTVDGDIITLYLNGEDVLDNYTTSKNKKEVTLHLRAGENYLVMYAVNLGRVPPNTACIEIDDGAKHKNITVNSDTKRSGALEILYKPAL